MTYAFVHPRSMLLRAKPAGTASIVSEGPEGPEGPGPRPTPVSSSFDCTVCAVRCTTETARKGHRSGRSHLRQERLQELWEGYVASLALQRQTPQAHLVDEGKDDTTDRVDDGSRKDLKDFSARHRASVTEEGNTRVAECTGKAAGTGLGEAPRPKRPKVGGATSDVQLPTRSTNNSDPALIPCNK